MNESIKTPALTGISSMATRDLLADLSAAFRAKSRVEAKFESVGGVDAAKRVAAGEVFDVAVLAADAIDKLIASGHLDAASRRDVVRSDVVAAVKSGARRPDISTPAALKAAVQGARRIGYSTGPSGTALLKLFDGWGIAGDLAERLIQAPPGVPVGALIAKGDVELGFQQNSELVAVAGLDILGPLPSECAIVSTFSAARCRTARFPTEARALIDFLSSAETADAKRRRGMMSP
jgi:molybdate transport system substrate-binding protein